MDQRPDRVRSTIPEALTDAPVVAVLRAGHAHEYNPVVETLVSAGITQIELTLSTEGVVEELPRLIEAFGLEADIGVGTITNLAQAEAVIAAGAAFVVTPMPAAGVVEFAVERSVPVYPGGMTPAELLGNWAAGATAVKIFPASTVGAAYAAQLLGPFPGLRFIPSGGVGVNDAVAWMKAGAAAVSVGGPLLQDAFSGGSLSRLAQRSSELLDRVCEART